MISLLLLLILILVLIYGIYSNVQSPLTVKTYIITNYMYIFTALILFILTNTAMQQKKINLMNLNDKFIPLFILSIILLFGILFTPAKQQIPLHLMWLGFIILISVTGNPVYLLAKQEKILNKVLITLGVIFISLSYLTYTSRLDWLQPYSSYFRYGLLGLIILQSMDLIFSDDNKKQDTRFWYYSIFAIVIFSGLMVFSTLKIMNDAKLLEKNCKSISHLECANYPKKSINMFLNIINLFNNLTNVYRK